MDRHYLITGSRGIQGAGTGSAIKDSLGMVPGPRFLTVQYEHFLPLNGGEGYRCLRRRTIRGRCSQRELDQRERCSTVFHTGLTEDAGAHLVLHTIWVHDMLSKYEKSIGIAIIAYLALIRAGISDIRPGQPWSIFQLKNNLHVR